MAEIKTDENASGELDQDQTDGVISKARDVALNIDAYQDQTDGVNFLCEIR